MMNIESTATTRFKVVTLFRGVDGQLERFGSLISRDSQLIPWCWSWDGFVVCISVQQFNRVAIPTMICTFLPELRTIQVRIRNTDESEHGNGQGKLDDAEDDRKPGHAPLEIHPRAGWEAHRR